MEIEVERYVNICGAGDDINWGFESYSISRYIFSFLSFSFLLTSKYFS